MDYSFYLFYWLDSLKNTAWPQLHLLSLTVNKRGVKRRNTLDRLDQYVAQHGLFVKQSYYQTV